MTLVQSMILSPNKYVGKEITYRFIGFGGAPPLGAAGRWNTATGKIKKINRNETADLEDGGMIALKDIIHVHS